MNIDVKAVHFDLNDETRDFIDKKMEKFDFVKDMLVDVLFTLTKEKNYLIEVTMNFRWGVSSHIKVKSYELHEGLDTLFDKMDKKIRKEKEKITEHKPS